MQEAYLQCPTCTTILLVPNESTDVMCCSSCSNLLIIPKASCHGAQYSSGQKKNVAYPEPQKQMKEATISNVKVAPEEPGETSRVIAEHNDNDDTQQPTGRCAFLVRGFFVAQIPLYNLLSILSCCCVPSGHAKKKGRRRDWRDTLFGKVGLVVGLMTSSGWWYCLISFIFMKKPVVLHTSLSTALLICLYLLAIFIGTVVLAVTFYDVQRCGQICENVCNICNSIVDHSCLCCCDICCCCCCCEKKKAQNARKQAYKDKKHARKLNQKKQKQSDSCDCCSYTYCYCWFFFFRIHRTGQRAV